MIESAASRIVQSSIVKHVLALVNRVPLPFHRLPVTVHGHRMVARTLARFLALWFWKFGVFGAAEIGLLGRVCRGGVSGLEIGANGGVHTPFFAPTGKASLYRSSFHCDRRVSTAREAQQGVPVDGRSGAESGPAGPRVDLVKM